MVEEMDVKISEVENECYLIDKGIRSCALLTVSEFYQDRLNIIAKLEEIVLNHKLHSYIFRYETSEYNLSTYIFWIYKYHHQLALIKYVETKGDSKDFLSEWVTGKLLGYSDESMESYLTMKLVDNLEISSID